MNVNICIILDQRAKYVLSSVTIISQMLSFLISARLLLEDIKVLCFNAIEYSLGGEIHPCAESAQSLCQTQALS